MIFPFWDPRNDRSFRNYGGDTMGLPDDIHKNHPDANDGMTNDSRPRSQSRNQSQIRKKADGKTVSDGSLKVACCWNLLRCNRNCRCVPSNGVSRNLTKNCGLHDGHRCCVHPRNALLTNGRLMSGLLLNVP